MRALLLALLVAALLATSTSLAFADDLGVTRVEIEEHENGRVEIVALVPPAWAQLLSPPELLGHGVFESAGYQREGGGGVVYELELGERRLGTDDVLLLPWQRQAALTRITLADGTTTRRFFRRTGRGIEVPIRSVKPELVGPLEWVQTTALDGVRHVSAGWFHLALILLLGIAASLRRAGGLLFAFLLGQFVALVLAALLGVRLPSGVAELAFVLAVLIVARDALRPTGIRTALIPVLGAAGLVHGLGLASVVLPGGNPTEMLLVIVGIDGAHLVGVTFLALVATALRRLHFARGLADGISYAVGIGAAAVLVLFVLGDARATALSMSPTPGPRVLEDDDPTPLPITRAPPGSQRIAPQQADAPIQSFLTVEPFEIRHDVLLRLKDLAEWIPPSAAESRWIETDIQAELLRRLGEQVAARTAIEVDGRTLTPIVDRVDFVTVGPKGTLPRLDRIREAFEEARVGVVITMLTPGMPQSVSLTWSSIPDGVLEIPATVTDPESSRAATLSHDAAALVWKNELREDPIPSVDTVRREPPRVPIPWFSLALLVLAAVLVARVVRRRAGELTLVLVRILLLAALLTAPLVQTAVALPETFRGTPSPAQAQRILGSLLTNVYRSFSFREESDVYDRLALSVDGDQLSDTYLEQSRALEMAERGGARARVEAVEILGVRHVEKTEDGGFVAQLTWSVGGSVSHFGHRHFRQNHYTARVRVTPFGDAWKITSVEVQDMKRAL